MNREDIIEDAIKKNMTITDSKLYEAVYSVAMDAVDAEREKILGTVNELFDDRHPMFSDGYSLALQHIRGFILGRGVSGESSKS